MSEWDKLWENMPLPVTDQWGRTDNGPFMAFIMTKVKVEGGRIQRKLEAVEEKLDEQGYIINTIYERCEGCEGRKDGFACPAKSFIELEVTTI